MLTLKTSASVQSALASWVGAIVERGPRLLFDGLADDGAVDVDRHLARDDDQAARIDLEHRRVRTGGDVLPGVARSRLQRVMASCRCLP